MGHDDIEARVETALAERLPEVDLLELTVLATGGGMLRLVVDHPDGVDHEVCATVTRVLDEAGLLEEYGAEVWSPGPEPPLRRPEHFRRVAGHVVRVRADLPTGPRTVTGTLVEADDASLRVRVADEVVEIPLDRVRRANAVEEAGGSIR
jgi:ribosome maturation factor RimP